MSESFSFCPLCQLPLKAINISPDVHVSMCMSRGDDNIDECPKGVHCLSDDVFHYRDFSHKVLAAYRSSADFVPPNVEINPSPKKGKSPKKQPKRSSPRKINSPEKSKQKRNVLSDSDSDTDILIQPKKPRRNVKLNKTQPINNPLVNIELDEKSQKSHTVRPNSGKSNKVKTSKLRCDSFSKVVLSAEKEVCDLIKTNAEPKLTVVNVKLNEGGEIRFTKSRSQSSLSSLSITTVDSSNINETDVDSEFTSEGRKVVPKTNSVQKIILKEPVLVVESTAGDGLCSKSKPKTVEKLSKIEARRDTIESHMNVSLDRTDFDDIIPGSMLDKELLKTIEKNLDSPTTTVHTFSECNDTSTSTSSGNEDVANNSNNEELTDVTSSSDVIVRSRDRKSAALLTSSSDSDLPLAEIFRKKSATKVEKIIEVKGKVKAGKVLRTPNKAPVYLNGSNLKISLGKTSGSGKDSDSGKSSASKDISFVPSERSSSSQQSDSAFSAESTDRLTTSSVSSTDTSSEELTDSHKSDPSYSEESDIAYNNSRSHQRTISLTPKRKANQLSSLSDTSQSEISIKEKQIFHYKKKSPKSNKSVNKSKETFHIPVFNLQDTTDSDEKSGWHSLLTKMRTSCFPSDLKIDSEDSLTMASSCSGSDTSQATAMLPLRQCPFYKRIPDTPFAVDAFQYWNIPGVKIYFLSHFHSDHYIGIKKNFSQPIYCSQITASLVRMKLRVDEKWLHVLELNKPYIICGVEVTALDANHCPGSFMFLFCLTNGCNYLHVGDFRASKSMTKYSCLQTVSVSKLFLDTTYCSPQYCFPTQEEVISKVIETIRGHIKANPRTLVVCGSYTIGKEKVFIGIAEALDWCIWARPEKQRIFSCLNDPRINSRLVKDCRSAQIHVLPMASIQIKALHQHLESCTGAFSHVVGIKPTGWELNSKSSNFKVTSKDNVTVYGVPYSEHSSFAELRDFVQFLQPHEVIPTVNVASVASRGKMSKHFSEWLNPHKQTSEKQKKVSQYFKSSNS